MTSIKASGKEISSRDSIVSKPKSKELHCKRSLTDKLTL